MHCKVASGELAFRFAQPFPDDANENDEGRSIVDRDTGRISAFRFEAEIGRRLAAVAMFGNDQSGLGHRRRDVAENLRRQASQPGTVGAGERFADSYAFQHWSAVVCMSPIKLGGSEIHIESQPQV
jgi:hypothetical protein